MRRGALLFSAVVVPVLLSALGVAFFALPTPDRSEFEGRRLAERPVFSATSLWAGTYTRELELFVADRFPLREHLVRFTFALKAHLGLRREATVYTTAGGALGGMERPQDWRPPEEEPSDAGAPEVEFLEALDAGDAGDAGEPEVEVVVAEEPDAGEDTPWGPEPTERGGVLIHQGRGLMLLSATDETARQFAKVLAAYGAAFPKARVYAVMVPGAGAFYLPASHRDRSADERHNLEVMREALPPNVRWVDVLGALEPHADEAIYYRTDHHWTGLGAYYGSRAMLEAAGLEQLPRESFEWRTNSHPTLGSLFRMTQDTQLERTPDVTEYPVPPVKVTSVSLSGAAWDVPRKRPLLDEGAKGYLVYLGGDVPLMAAKTPVKNGRRALLVKNSFGNPLGPLLTPHFEQVVVVDYRLYFGTIASLVKRFRITDVFVQNATLTANDPYHRGRLKLALFTTVTFTDGGVVLGR